MFVPVIVLPGSVQNALRSVGYAKSDIKVSAVETVSMFDAGSNGMRGFFTLINMGSGEFSTTYGSWGGANAFESNPVDRNEQNHALPANFAAIKGASGSPGTFAQVYVHPSNVAAMLPKVAEVSQREKDILDAFKSLTSAGRKDSFARGKVKAPELATLVQRGLLKANKAGAMSITTEGKNAAMGGRYSNLERNY